MASRLLLLLLVVAAGVTATLLSPAAAPSVSAKQGRGMVGHNRDGRQQGTTETTESGVE